MNSRTAEQVWNKRRKPFSAIVHRSADLVTVDESATNLYVLPSSLGGNKRLSIK